MKILLAILVVALSGSTGLSAQDTPTCVRKLLKELWGGGVEAQRQSESLFSRYKSENVVIDADVQWAYVLNRIDYDRYREARSGIDGLSARRTGDWDVPYARIWLKIVVGEIDAALIDMQNLKKAMASTGNVDESIRIRLFSRLGRLYGFAEGPGREKATPVTLEETLSVLTDALDDVDLGAFEDQRLQVTKKYTELMNEKSSTIATQVEQKKKENVSRAGEIANENRQMDTRQNMLNSELSKLRDEGTAEISRLKQTARPIESDLRSLDRDLGMIDNRLIRISNDVAFLEHEALHEPPGIRRDELMFRAHRARQELFSEQMYRSSLQGQYNSAATQLDRIYSQISAVEQQYGGQISVREQESRQIVKQRRRNQREMSKLNNPQARTGYVRSMNARTSHLPTYDPFPTAEMRQQLLKRFP